MLDPHSRSVADTLAGVPPSGLVALPPGRTAAEERADTLAWLEALAADAEGDAANMADKRRYGCAEAFMQRATSYRAAIVALTRGDHEGMRQ